MYFVNEFCNGRHQIKFAFRLNYLYLIHVIMNKINVPIRMGTREAHVCIVIASFLFNFISLSFTGTSLSVESRDKFDLPTMNCSMSNVLLCILYSCMYTYQHTLPLLGL